MNQEKKQQWNELFNNTIWSALQLIAEYKNHIDTNNLIELRKVKHKLQCRS